MRSASLVVPATWIWSGLLIRVKWRGGAEKVELASSAWTPVGSRPDRRGHLGIPGRGVGSGIGSNRGVLTAGVQRVATTERRNVVSGTETILWVGSQERAGRVLPVGKGCSGIALLRTGPHLGLVRRNRVWAKTKSLLESLTSKGRPSRSRIPYEGEL